MWDSGFIDNSQYTTNGRVVYTRRGEITSPLNRGPSADCSLDTHLSLKALSGLHDDTPSHCSCNLNTRRVNHGRNAPQSPLMSEGASILKERSIFIQCRRKLWQLYFWTVWPSGMCETSELYLNNLLYFNDKLWQVWLIAKKWVSELSQPMRVLCFVSGGRTCVVLICAAAESSYFWWRLC